MIANIVTKTLIFTNHILFKFFNNVKSLTKQYIRLKIRTELKVY